MNIASTAFEKVRWAAERPTPLDYRGPTDIKFDPFDTSDAERPIIELFERIAARFPDKLAVDDGVTRWTYAELLARVRDLAARMAPFAPADSVVVAVIPSTVVFPTVLLAALALGCVLIPIDTSHPFERKVAILAQAHARAIVLAEGVAVDENLISPEMPTIVEGAAVWGDLPFTSRPSAPSSIVGVGFTSGSTGNPKGLAYSQRATLRFVAEYVNSMHVNPQDRILSLASLAAGGNLDLLAALLTGASVRMLDIKTAGLAEVLRVLEADQISLLNFIPLVFRALASAEGAERAFASMRAICIGGDRTFGRDLELYRAKLPPDCHIRLTQGSTETAVLCHWFVPRDFVTDPEETAPSGYIGEGKTVALLSDEQDAPGEGELVVRSRDMSAGIWRDGGVAPGPFVQAPEDPGMKVFHTGDVVRLGPDGLIRFIGRRDRQIKVLGLRADPAEVEAAFRRCSGVGDVVVIPRRVTEEAVFIAFVVPQDLRSPPSASDLRRKVAAELPVHMVPAEVHLLPSVPRLPNLKPDLVALDALDHANRRDSVSGSVAREASTEVREDVREAVQSAWSEMLGDGSLEAGLPWDEAGGDSFLALQMMFHIERTLGLQLPLDVFDGRATPEGLAREISRHLDDDAADHAAGRRATVFLVPGLFGDEPRLASFRRQLALHLRFTVLQYPDWREDVAIIGEYEAIASRLLQAIAEVAPRGPVHLAGYSIGGRVAFDLARRLRAAGRTVGFVALFDTPYAGGGDVKEWRASRRRREAWEEAMGGVTPEAPLRRRLRQATLELLAAARLFGVLRLIIRVGAFLKPRGGGVGARRALLLHTRGQALSSLTVQPYDGDVWLFRAKIQEKQEARDLGWGAVCAKLHVIEVEGNHRSILGTELPAFAARFLAAFQAAGEAAGAPRVVQTH